MLGGFLREKALFITSAGALTSQLSFFLHPQTLNGRLLPVKPTKHSWGLQNSHSLGFQTGNSISLHTTVILFFKFRLCTFMGSRSSTAAAATLAKGSTHWVISKARPQKVDPSDEITEKTWQARYGHHPSRHCSLCSLPLRLDNWRWKQSPTLDDLKRWVRPHTLSTSHIQWACYKKWKVEREAQNGICVNIQHLPSEIPVNVLPWICQSEAKWLSRKTGR